MTAYFSGTTLVVVPENDEEREQLKYYGTGHLWECYGIDETDGHLSVQPMCPVGLGDAEIMDHIRFMLQVGEE